MKKNAHSPGAGGAGVPPGGAGPLDTCPSCTVGGSGGVRVRRGGPSGCCIHLLVCKVPHRLSQLNVSSKAQMVKP